MWRAGRGSFSRMRNARATLRLFATLGSLAAVASGVAVGCGDDAAGAGTAAAADASVDDASTDATTTDAASADGGAHDATTDDVTVVDAADTGVDAAVADADADAATDASDASVDADGAVLDAAPPNDPTVVRLVSGSELMCVLRADGKAKCWGDANFLGIGATYPDNRGDDAGEMGAALPFVNLGTGVWIKSLFGGSYSYSHCGLLNTGLLRCFGTNTYGELGGDLADAAIPYRGDKPGEMGDVMPIVDLGTGRTAVYVSTTNAHSCAILDNGKVKCWGNNGDGQLGILANDTRGDGPGEMGDNLPYVDFGTGRTAKSVHTCNARSCVITDQSKVKCWGSGTDGQLGRGSTAGVGGPSTAMGDSLADIDLGTGRTALAITGGLTFACALLDDHSVKCWGYNQFGELGQGDTTNRGDNAGEMGDNLKAIDLGTGRTAMAIASGADHTCALLDDATVKCWGKNFAGQLGYGDTNPRGTGAMGDTLKAVNLGTGRTAKAIAMGASSSCAVLDDGTVKCWGSNSYGQLGVVGPNRGDNSGEMGDSLPALDLGP